MSTWKNTPILEIVDFLNARARENQWGFVDFNRPMVAINQWEQAADALRVIPFEDLTVTEKKGASSMRLSIPN